MSHTVLACKKREKKKKKKGGGEGGGTDSVSQTFVHGGKAEVQTFQQNAAVFRL